MGQPQPGPVLEPAARLADRGFVVDETFRLQTAENQPRFEAFTTTPDLFLPDGAPPAVGTLFENPDLARTYRRIGRLGTDWFYDGQLARDITAVVQSPPKSPDTTLPVPEGFMRPRDLAEYGTIVRRPTQVGYRGYQVHGMPPSSSGGTTVGEALNIMEELRPRRARRAAARLPRGQCGGVRRPRHVRRRPGVHPGAHAPAARPELRRRTGLRDRHGHDRGSLCAGDVESYDGVCDPGPTATGDGRRDTENRETTNLTVADRWGNVVEYTLTIEQTGGAGLLVPDRGFLLNNELTDFSLVWSATDPNRLEGGKRPRSSMSPTILTRDGRPFLALGSPGRLDDHHHRPAGDPEPGRPERSLPRSVREPRASQRNTPTVSAEQAFIDRYGAAADPVRPHVRAPGGTGNLRGGDRRADRDRVPWQPADGRGGRADPPWRRIGAGGRPAVAPCVGRRSRASGAGEEGEVVLGVATAGFNPARRG